MNKKGGVALASKVIIYYLFFSIISVAGILAGFYFVQANDLKSSALERIEIAAQGKELALDIWVHAKENELTALGRIGVLQDLVEGAQEATNAISFLQQYQVNQTDIEQIRVTDLTGKIIASTSSAEIGTFITDEQGFTQGQAGVTVFNRYPSVQNRMFGLTVTGPLTDRTGVDAGVVLVDYKGEVISSLVSDVTGLGETGDAYLVSSLNLLVTDSRFELADYTDVVSSWGIESALAGSDGVDEYVNYLGNEVIGAYRWMPERHLALIVEMNTSEIIAPARDMVNLGLTTAGVVLLLLTFVIYLLMKQITTPIKRVESALQNFAKGNFTARVSLDQEDEIGQLSRAFDEMAQKFQQNEKEKHEFITASSHQLQAPVSDIKFKLSILVDELSKKASTKKFLPAIDSLKGSSENATEIMVDLLTILEIQGGFIPTKFKQTSLQRVISVVVNSFKDRIAEKQIKLKVSVPEHVLAKMNESLFKTALNHLLDNAITYSDSKGIVHLIAKEREEDVLISIADQGIGIPMTEHAKVFDQFFRAKNSLQKKIAGTGLGLYIVKTIVEDHGGEIGFKSEEGKGSLFYFTIPKK